MHSPVSAASIFSRGQLSTQKHSDFDTKVEAGKELTDLCGASHTACKERVMHGHDKILPCFFLYPQIPLSYPFKGDELLFHTGPVFLEDG